MRTVTAGVTLDAMYARLAGRLRWYLRALGFHPLVRTVDRLEALTVLGVVENMSGFICPCCGTEYDLFGRGGGEELARIAEVPFLGRVPLEMAVREGGDAGQPTVLAAPDSRAGQALREVAERVVEELEKRAATP